MNNPVLQLSDTTWQVSCRGNKMTLSYDAATYEWSRWTVVTDNASARAWNNGHPSARFFRSLAEVEAKYKTLRGISKLIQLDGEAEKC